MLTVQKEKDRDFLILNLTDTHLSDAEWAPGCEKRRILEGTIRTLMERVRPDLVTVSGDLSYIGNVRAYEMLADFLDSFGVPWAPVWGNHDDEEGPEAVERVVRGYLKHPLCLYERGPAELGNGNYVILVEEEGRPAEGLLMMDSHDRETFTGADGKPYVDYARLLPAQLDWMKEQIRALSAAGCADTTLILHMPIYAYRSAAEAALRAGIDGRAVTKEEADGTGVWNPGYEASFGLWREGICSPPVDEGAFDVLLEGGTTRHVIAGHDHVNTFAIPYRGIWLCYGLKTGTGSYWEEGINGGTVLRVTSRGVAEVRHEFVEITPWRDE